VVALTLVAGRAALRRRKLGDDTPSLSHAEAEAEAEKNLSGRPWRGVAFFSSSFSFWRSIYLFVINK
jgi:hypothetical protein